MREFVGREGIGADEIAKMLPVAQAAIEAMKANRPSMKWRELPYTQDDVVEDIIKTAGTIRESFDNFVVLGIGGSALGPIAVHQALRHLRYNELPKPERGGPKLYIEDNIDPERMQALFDVIDPAKTMFNVITKSGSTSETMAQFLIVADVLRKKLGDRWTKNVIATTDSEKGNLIKIAKQYGLKTYYVPDGVGGRFSQLCPVGLLAASVTGIDISQMLRGAKHMDQLSDSLPLEQNPAYMPALLQVIFMRRGKNISVMMPYADSLKYMSDWYAQLWAESLGKRVDRSGREVFAGQTPVRALGVTDQHSQIQLYTEGPFDKVITFLRVGEYAAQYPIAQGFDDIQDVAFLGGHTLNELIQAELSATEYALTKSGRPNCTITLPKVNAFNIGQLICMLELQTAFAGELLGINAFDQPGVEEGKNATYALLGKPGYDEKRAELSKAPVKSAKYII